MTGTEGAELLAEQGFISTLYARLDQMREETVRLRDTYLRDSDGTPGGRVQRDIAYAAHAQTLVDLNVAEDKLCFGRLEATDGDDMHIGRMGIFSEGEVREQLLMDWRAPSARPFYVATAAAPLGVRRRRHLRVRRRQVKSISDEYLDLTGLSPDDPALGAPSGAGLTGEAALLAALNAPRTGRMGDIVETIQAEQDRIIRAERSGILVVQGGPGTGKTAVALHRTAYLLYTHRNQLANRGVLVIGPNRTFLNYIGQVLPSLGENAVVLSTIGDLFPGVRAQRVESSAAAVLKGRLNMAKVIANAVLDRQRMPRTTITVPYDGGTLRLDKQLLSRAQDRAWQSRLPHNRARNIFLRTVLNQLARQVARRHSQGTAAAIPMTSEDFDDIRRDLRGDEDLQRVLSGIWPGLTAQTVLRDLLTSTERLKIAAPFLSDSERDLLVADPTRPFSQSDVPLLDEVAELLGQDDRVTLAAAAADREQRQEYAQSVLDMLGGGEAATDGETTDSGAGPGDASLLGMVSAADLVELQDDRVLLTSTAERAGADREWTYGHIVVDEAQELSPMAWRMVMRRCPVRSMTLVGDLAQTGDAAGASSWGSVLRPYVGRDWRFEELTVNYRTPAEITVIADRVLASIDPKLTAPTSVRSTGVDPWWLAVPRADLIDRIAEMAAKDLAEAGEQHLAVLVPDDLFDRALAKVVADVPGAGSGTDVDNPVVVLTVREAKGLEFDSVILVEPDEILAQSPRGRNDLYVAITRATQRLGVLYTGRRPAFADPAPEADSGLW